MRVITGGSGFLGMALANLLVGKGLPVRLFDLRKPESMPAGAEFARGDIRDPSAVAAACRGAEVVYHFAALLPQRKAPAKVMRTVHIGGLKNVLAACDAAGVPSLVCLSSTEVYGVMETIPCPETAPRRPVGEYGRNKVECEDICMARTREGKPRISILRPPTLTGPGIVDEGIIAMMRQARRGGPIPVIGSGANRVQMLDVRDCAEAAFLCGESGKAAGEIFNVRAPDVPSMREMAKEMKRIAGSRSLIVSIPARIGIGALRLLDTAGLSPVRPEHYELMTFDFVSDISKIEKLLGWEPRISWRKSLADMYERHFGENIRRR